MDYDGEQVLADWRAERPRTPEQQNAFVDPHCPLVVQGIASIARYCEQLRNGKKPVHMTLG